MWESCRMMSLGDGFPRISPVSPSYSGTSPFSHRFNLIGSPDHDPKSRPNLFTNSLYLCRGLYKSRSSTGTHDFLKATTTKALRVSTGKRRCTGIKSKGLRRPLIISHYADVAKKQIRWGYEPLHPTRRNLGYISSRRTPAYSIFGPRGKQEFHWKWGRTVTDALCPYRTDRYRSIVAIESRCGKPTSLAAHNQSTCPNMELLFWHYDEQKRREMDLSVWLRQRGVTRWAGANFLSPLPPPQLPAVGFSRTTEGVCRALIPEQTAPQSRDPIPGELSGRNPSTVPLQLQEGFPGDAVALIGSLRHWLRDTTLFKNTKVKHPQMLVCCNCLVTYSPTDSLASPLTTYTISKFPLSFNVIVYVIPIYYYYWSYNSIIQEMDMPTLKEQPRYIVSVTTPRPQENKKTHLPELVVARELAGMKESIVGFNSKQGVLISFIIRDGTEHPAYLKTPVKQTVCEHVAKFSLDRRMNKAAKPMSSLLRLSIFTTLQLYRGATVAERLASSPPTKANRVQSPAGSLLNFRKWESSWTMPLVSGFSRRSPVSPVLIFRRCSILTSFALIRSQDLVVKSRSNHCLLLGTNRNLSTPLEDFVGKRVSECMCVGFSTEAASLGNSLQEAKVPVMKKGGGGRGRSVHTEMKEKTRNPFLLSRKREAQNVGYQTQSNLATKWDTTIDQPHDNKFNRVAGSFKSVYPRNSIKNPSSRSGKEQTKLKSDRSMTYESVRLRGMQLVVNEGKPGSEPWLAVGGRKPEEGASEKDIKHVRREKDAETTTPSPCKEIAPEDLR
ncbi:hypothetical protein PR048_025192 [Dryococelus australis]|uniref:Uncharacterized protein n=1 Tax=Dryococelus australis TaxID=614101 RepID=A0ABQ9GQQ4_9NEOP|nr:hypothetical protein PR048_025192 [Dryococelus australis]